MNKIKLIIGLGNPGKEYERTKHNAGFLFIDELARHLNTGELEFKKKLFSEIAESEFSIFNSTTRRRSSGNRIIENSELKIIIAKPQTFINKSGMAAESLAKYFKIKPENILVVHDDIDILWSNFKFSFGRSSAGHKGVESIIKALKTKNFWRLRIGIQPTLKKHTPADKIILKKFTPAELKILNQTIKKAVSELD